MGDQKAAVKAEPKPNVQAPVARPVPAPVKIFAPTPQTGHAQEAARVAAPDSGKRQPSNLMRLQHAVGNQAVQRIMQAKRPGAEGQDAFEKEAERSAEVVGGGKPFTPRERVASSRATPKAQADVLASISAPGARLDPVVRETMQGRLGHDFSDVRVHTGARATEAARAQNALAYTVGKDIVFGAGQYAPTSHAGQRLLAHELTHVVQQSSQPGRIVQRNGTPDYSTETKDGFAGRVKERAQNRLTQNIGVLGQWSTYVNAMEGFQLRAQLLTQVATSFAATAAATPGGRQRYEWWAGTQNEAERSMLGYQFDVESTYRERVYSFVDFLDSRAVTGYYTTPSVAQNLEVLAGDRGAQDLPQQVYVPPDPRYAEYADTLRRYRAGKIGGCQFCHEINFEWQRTADRWGSPMPRGNFFDIPDSQASRSGFSSSRFGRDDQAAIMAYLQGGTPAASGANNPTPSPAPPQAAPQAAVTAQPPAVPQNPFAPTIAVPTAVDVPAPRTDLCGDLPPTKDADRVPQLASWGPNSEIVASVIVRIDSVLTPLGPRGYRVLPRQDFDALYAMSPENMVSVRDGIIRRIDERKQKYADLRADIQRGGVPYEELCPIVDELLPTTNAFVRSQVLEDVHRWQERERTIQILELVLLALSILFPPSVVVTVPAGMALGLARISLGIDQRRQGRQWTQGTGAGVYSLRQQSEAPGLAARGRSNIISGSLEFGLSAFAFARMVSEAQASARFVQALQDGAIITDARFPGVALLARDGKLVMVTQTGEILGYGTISQSGQIYWTRLASPFSYAPGTAAAGTSGAGSTAMVPVGPTAMVPYGSQFGGGGLTFGGGQLGGGAPLAPYSGGALAVPSVGGGVLAPNQLLLPPGPNQLMLPPGPNQLMLPSASNQLMLPAGPNQLLLPPGNPGPVVDPGGRGLFTVGEPQIARLAPTDAARLRELQVRMPASEAELAELVALRQRAAGGPLAEIPGTPEHMLARWRQYSSPPRNGSMTFQQWAAGHPSRMANSVTGPAVEERYRVALEQRGTLSRSAVVQSPSGQARQVDALIEGAPGQRRVMIQIKAGEESLTTAPRQSGGASRGSSSLSNAAALATDAEFIAAGDRVVWVFEGRPSGPLVARARELGIDVIIRVDDAAARTRMIQLMGRAGMSEADINAVTIVTGTREETVAYVAQRFGSR